MFARKPLWGYRLAVAGMLGVALLSFFVWQHHLFVSGINADLRPFYMLSTELISLPTGFIFLCAMGTIWRGRIRFTVPMLFCLGWVFNFLIGGISGVFLLRRSERRHDPRQLLLDGALPLHDHGRAGVHVLRRDLLLGAEDDRLRSTSGSPRSTSGRCSWRSTRRSRRCSRSASSGCHGAWSPTRPTSRRSTSGSRVSAFVIGLSMLVFLVNVVWSLLLEREPAEANPWQSKSPSGSCRRRCRSTTSTDPGVRRRPVSVRRRAPASSRALAPRRRRGTA